VQSRVHDATKDFEGRVIDERGEKGGQREKQKVSEQFSPFLAALAGTHNPVQCPKPSSNSAYNNLATHR
jgi:hypothetical protein